MPAKYVTRRTTRALRLYRVPRESQLLRRLGPDWDPLVQTGSHWVLPGARVNPNRRTGSGRSAQRPTALEALGARIPFDGPRADVVAVAPWEVPNWRAQLNYMGVVRPQARKDWVDGLYEGLPDSGVAIINLAGTVSNKGRYDDLIVGGAAAILTEGSNGETHAETRTWALGSEVEAHDVNLFGLAKAAVWVTEFYAERPPPLHTFISYVVIMVPYST
jgi:hypothetical protein